MIRRSGLKPLHPDYIFLDSRKDSHGGVNRFSLVLVGNLRGMITNKLFLFST